jgi:hypothetical protein
MDFRDRERLWEIYSQMMSSQDVKVSYNNSIRTADFNLETGEISIPVYKTVKDSMEQGMVIHEIGHALFSRDLLPRLQELCERHGKPCVNVLEDVWAESKIKEAYPGVARVMREGYTGFNGMDFFEIKKSRKPLGEYGLLDRINIHFKLGHIYDVPFSREEGQVVSRLAKMGTREEFFELLEAVSGLVREENQSGPQPMAMEQGPGGMDQGLEARPGAGPSLELPEEPDREADSQQGDREQETGQAPSQGSLDELSDDPSPELETQKKFNENLQRDAKVSKGPQLVFKYDTKKAMEECLELESSAETFRRLGVRTDPENARLFSNKWFDNFVRDAAHVVSGEFNNRKATQNFDLSKVVSMGSIDFSKLAKHRTHENIFKKKLIMPKQNNHALVVSIDTSGSVKEFIGSFILQAAITLEFCKMNGIEFEVFGYGSHEWPRGTEPPTGSRRYMNLVRKVCDSKTYSLDLFKFLFENVKSGRFHRLREILSLEGGCTPTDAAACVAAESVRRFRSQGIENVINFLFTDGLANFSGDVYERFKFLDQGPEAKGHPEPGDCLVCVNNVRYNTRDYVNRGKEALKSAIVKYTMEGKACYELQSILRFLEAGNFSAFINIPILDYIKNELGAKNVFMAFDRPFELSLLYYYLFVDDAPGPGHLGNFLETKKINDDSRYSPSEVMKFSGRNNTYVTKRQMGVFSKIIFSFVRKDSLVGSFMFNNRRGASVYKLYRYFLEFIDGQVPGQDEFVRQVREKDSGLKLRMRSEFRDYIKILCRELAGIIA